MCLAAKNQYFLGTLIKGLLETRSYFVWLGASFF